MIGRSFGRCGFDGGRAAQGRPDEVTQFVCFVPLDGGELQINNRRGQNSCGGFHVHPRKAAGRGYWGEGKCKCACSQSRCGLHGGKGATQTIEVY